MKTCPGRVWRRPFFPVVLLALGFLLLASLSTIPAASSPGASGGAGGAALQADSLPSPPDDPYLPGTVVRGGRSPDLVFLFTSEVMGWTEPCG